MNVQILRDRKFMGRIFATLFVMLALAAGASAQRRVPIERMGERVVQIKVGEITLESIDFRNQTARLSLALDVANGFVPVSLKDFDYRLRLNGQETIEGYHDGTLRIGGRKSSRVNLPLTVNLRSIPGTVWSAFRNRGQVAYELDTAFTLPLFVMEKRFDQSFAGEVPLRSLVDAASILRASRMSDGGGGSQMRQGDWRDIFGF
jgi:LEA14-like dessication related protein